MKMGRPKKILPEEKIVEMYKRGEPISFIRFVYHCSGKLISEILKKHGVEIRKNTLSKMIRK